MKFERLSIYLSLLILYLALTCACPMAWSAQESACSALQAVPEYGLHVVLVPDGYATEAEFHADAEDIILGGLRAMEPWKSHRGIVGVYAVWPGEDLCERRRVGHLTPYLICDHAKLVSAAHRCGFSRYKIVVLSREEFTSYAPVTRIQNSVVFLSAPARYEPTSAEPQPRNEKERRRIQATFLHEFGHAFGLKDEWAPLMAKAKSPALRPDGPNCAPDRATAKTWWGDLVGSSTTHPAIGLVGYYTGCAGDAGFIKPTNNSLMGTMDLQLDYGPVSERYLRRVLDYCFSGRRPDAREDPGFFNLYPEYLACAR